MQVKARTRVASAVVIGVAGVCSLVSVAVVSLRAERDVEAIAPSWATIEVVPVVERGREPVDFEEPADEG